MYTSQPSRETCSPSGLRDRLVAVSLEWERAFGVAPQITSAISEFDAAILIGCNESSYCIAMEGRTAVSRGHDFAHNDMRFQVKANRPSGKPGSFVTKVAKATNYDWDFLLWLLYDRDYNLVEAWSWPVVAYQKKFESLSRVSPQQMRDESLAKRIYPQH